MEQHDRLYRDYQALEERLSRLSAASLRINESLDFDAVLQGALDSALYGVITLPDRKHYSGEARAGWRGT